MKKCCNNKVKFITNGLSTYAMCALLLSLVGSGIISIFNLSGNLVTYFYILSLSVNFLFILLLIIRIPFYIKGKKNS